MTAPRADDREVLAELCRRGSGTASEIATAFDVHTNSVAAALSRLEDQGTARPRPTPGYPRGNGAGVRVWEPVADA